MPADDELYEIEVLDGEVVPLPYAELEPAAAESLPIRTTSAPVQTAVVAATGFVAGAATMALLRRYGQSRLERAAPQAAPPARIGQVRAYVVHVRQLG